MAGMGHFRLPHWEGGHQPWEHPSAGTPRPWAPQLPPHVVARKGLCQPLQAPPNHPSHPRAPRLCPTSSTLITSPAPCCPCAQQQPWSSPGQGAPPDLQRPFTPPPRNPGPALWDLLAATQGNPHELGHPETHRSCSFPPPTPSYETPRAPLLLAGDCRVPGHAAAMTHSSAGRCFSMPRSFPSPLASPLCWLGCTPKPQGCTLGFAGGPGSSASPTTMAPRSLFARRWPKGEGQAGGRRYGPEQGLHGFVWAQRRGHCGIALPASFPSAPSLQQASM